MNTEYDSGLPGNFDQKNYLELYLFHWFPDFIVWHKKKKHKGKYTEKTRPGIDWKVKSILLFLL